ncbi:MAG: hypothetical protein ACE5F4_01665 [Candidatus Paceibacteria bacterium]
MVDAPKVVFNENQDTADFKVPRAESKGLTYRLVRMNVVSSPGDAAVLLGVFAVALIAVNIFLFAKSVPPPPVLGNDVPRPGETIPEYVR